MLHAFICLLIFPSIGTTTNSHTKDFINFTIVSTWADQLIAELIPFGDYVTRRKLVQKNFNQQANVVIRDGTNIVRDMAKEIKSMMELKIEAVRRIMDNAENMAMSNKDEVTKDFKYRNVNDLTDINEDSDKNYTYEGPWDIKLTRNENFDNLKVNTSYSAVHVPANVYDRSLEVRTAISWSEKLDSIFINNYEKDPSLSWQYFGSATGFMRQFPASEWKYDKVDLYDCRTRSWFIEAASSSKDIVILVDNSGSMTGMRREIARHVVNNILETLGNNDFVNIFTFSNGTTEIVTCFERTLVQATLANIRELKSGMEDISTQNIANFSAALTSAFELLNEYRSLREGARCNQAIMLITDGVPYNFKEIFEEYNWKSLPCMPVRVFTYLIGREVADVREVKWMACANRGYYVHLSTLAEVREQVLQYIPVMARPLVLSRTEHPISWTSVYADIMDPRMTDVMWDKKTREEQKEKVRKFNRNKNITDDEIKSVDIDDESGRRGYYRLMTSVSMPVFDRRENAVSNEEQNQNGNFTEIILVNEAIEVITKETRVANLLGVAGTDIPIEYIERFMMPHWLGVNGYAFIVTNNGFILTHPDLRPVFLNILKPAYNSIDMAEVELVDDNRMPRDFDPDLLAFREAVINQNAMKTVLQVKYHYDNMKRAGKIRRQYFSHGISNTSFTLVIAIPEPYGLYYIKPRPTEEIHRLVQTENPLDFFKDKNWRIHPEWTYCTYFHYNEEKRTKYPTPESEFRHFLERILKTGRWKWPLKRIPISPEMSNSTATKTDKLDYFCDRDLIQALVADAKATNWFPNNINDTQRDEKSDKLIQRYGLTTVFVATHSGLTRWQDLLLNTNDNRSGMHFSDLYSRATDEIWYKRAVDQHYIDPLSYVFAVPFDADNQSDTLVTVSHAVFKEEDNKKAPAAVVGFQFYHRAFHTLFMNVTSSCGKNCNESCTSDDRKINCFVLDNNGYVVVSKNIEETGKFFGEINGVILDLLIREGVYKKIVITDYQGVCFKDLSEGNPASILKTPFKHITSIMSWFLSYILWLLAKTSLVLSELNAYGFASEEFITEQPLTKINEKEFENKMKVNKTRPEPCDKKITLYQFSSDLKDLNINNSVCTSDSETSRPFVVRTIPRTNMILLVIDALCKVSSDTVKISIVKEKIEYNQSESLACYKAQNDKLARRRPSSCINSHINESQIELCGRGISINASVFLLFSSVAIAIMIIY